MNRRLDFRGGPAFDRRAVLRGGAVGIAGLSAGLLVGCGDEDDAIASTPSAIPTFQGEPPPETTRIRVPRTFFACNVPFLFVDEFLRDEGFTDVELVTAPLHYGFFEQMAEGVMDLGFLFVPETTYAIDQGLPLVMLGPANAGCTQIWAADEVRDLSDLRGRRLAIGPIPYEHPAHYSFVSSILQWVGISAGGDVELKTLHRSVTQKQPYGILSALQGHVDALWTWSPTSMSLADANAGHKIFDSFEDDPWRQYMCCTIISRRQFVEEYPVATRRALRAILKAMDLCQQEPGAAIERALGKGWIDQEAVAQRSFEQIRFDTWRSFDPEDSVLFYALRLHEAGLINSTPEEIIAKGTDWSFFNELKQELAFAPGRDERNLSFYCDPASPAKAARTARGRTTI
jgi:NitT/TauT family transport system substrate-binding protein